LTYEGAGGFCVFLCVVIAGSLGWVTLTRWWVNFEARINDLKAIEQL
jgi:hypothetical protein